MVSFIVRLRFKVKLELGLEVVIEEEEEWMISCTLISFLAEKLMQLINFFAQLNPLRDKGTLKCFILANTS